MSDSVRPHRQQPTRLLRPWDSPGKNTGVGCHFLLQCMKVKRESEVAQSCLILRDSMDCSLPGSSVHGIFQARVLEWGAIAFSDLFHTTSQLEKSSDACAVPSFINLGSCPRCVSFFLWVSQQKMHPSINLDPLQQLENLGVTHYHLRDGNIPTPILFIFSLLNL